MLEYWNAGMLECWNTGMMEYGVWGVPQRKFITHHSLLITSSFITHHFITSSLIIHTFFRSYVD